MTHRKSLPGKVATLKPGESMVVFPANITNVMRNLETYKSRGSVPSKLK